MATYPSRRRDLPPEYIAEWRESRGWSQEHLATLMDTDKGTISKLESGERHMNDKWLQKYSRAFNVPVTAFFRPPNQISLDDLTANIPDDLRQRITEGVAAMVKAGRA